jgi:hypothetical protein
VVWYTGQFYALFYLQTILKVDSASASFIVAVALVSECRCSSRWERYRTASAASTS